jgi:DNA-binding transcriptional regulator of glucitol operon
LGAFLVSLQAIEWYIAIGVGWLQWSLFEGQMQIETKQGNLVLRAGDGVVIRYLNSTNSRLLDFN